MPVTGARLKDKIRLLEDSGMDQRPILVCVGQGPDGQSLEATIDRAAVVEADEGNSVVAYILLHLTH